MARCHGNYEFSAETSGITEAERTPIRDQKDAAHESPRLTFTVQAITIHPAPRLSTAPGPGLLPGPWGYEAAPRVPGSQVCERG